MRKRRDWIAVAVVAALLAAASCSPARSRPARPARRSPLGTSPSPWPSPSAGVMLQVGQNGSFVKEYTLVDLEAMTPFRLRTATPGSRTAANVDTDPRR